MFYFIVCGSSQPHDASFVKCVKKKKKKQGVLRVEEWYISTGPFTIIELLPKRVIFSFPGELTVDICIVKDRGKTSASPVF